MTDKQKEYETRLAAETKRQQDEQAKQHALTTQQIYEDVSRTLKEEQKRINRHLKIEMEEKYQDKVKAIENEHQGAMAKERLAKSKVEIKVAQLEVQIEEMVKNSEDNKENTTNKMCSSRSASDKELTKKLKKLSRTMSTVK